MEVIVVPVVEVESSGWHSGRFVWANPKISNNFWHIFPRFFCIYYQTNLWLSGLKHLTSEVSGLSTRINFDVFFFKILQFSDILFFYFPKILANVEFIPINLIIFKAPAVQVWSSCCTGLTYFPPPSHCVSATKMQKQKQYMHLERLFYREGAARKLCKNIVL